jgi:hypothetical protein
MIGTPEEIADYVRDLTAELAKTTRAKRLDLLAYLLDMVALEASQLACGPAISERRAGKGA